MICIPEQYIRCGYASEGPNELRRYVARYLSPRQTTLRSIGQGHGGIEVRSGGFAQLCQSLATPGQILSRKSPSIFAYRFFPSVADHPEQILIMELCAYAASPVAAVPVVGHGDNPRKGSENGSSMRTGTRHHNSSHTRRYLLVTR